MHFISGLMVHRVPLVVAELGPDVGGDSALISPPTKAALAAGKAAA
jgi:hypothetical protein